MKIKPNIPKSIPVDKWSHNFVGLMIFVVSYLITLALNIEAFYALAVVLIAGVTKELYDKYIKKTFFDWMDVMATMFMATIMYIVIQFITLIIK